LSKIAPEILVPWRRLKAKGTNKVCKSMRSLHVDEELQEATM
jgi:hypothetical protein